MAKGYWIGHVEVREPDRYVEYARLAKAAVEKHGGVYLVRAGDNEAVEGTWRNRIVVIEFDSYQQALDCYRSDEYLTAKKIRVDVSEASLVIVEGNDNLPPGMR